VAACARCADLSRRASDKVIRSLISIHGIATHPAGSCGRSG
jgi:hypothetical protein